MYRILLQTLLSSYSPLDEGEQLYKSRILNFIHNEPRCFERSLLSGHLTASVWFLNTDYTHALLMHHAKLGKWLQLGGHCDGNANIHEVALKEAREESGITSIALISHLSH